MQARIRPNFTGRPQSRDLSISLTGAHEAAGTSPGDTELGDAGGDPSDPLGGGHVGRDVDDALADGGAHRPDDPVGSRLQVQDFGPVRVACLVLVELVAAGAAVTIIPSARETFGSLALESLSAGTPVVAYATGNLPALLGEGGVLVPPDAGPGALWRAARDLLADPVRYHQMSREAYCRSRNYGPAFVADTFLKAVYS
jgi:glycosyltransferase involved in cell wall biosynthesis